MSSSTTENFPVSRFSNIRALSAQAAVFDVDYTLLKRSSAVAFARTAIRHRLIPVSSLFGSALTHFLIQNGLARPRHLPRDLPFLAGLNKNVLDELADEAFLRYVIKAIYPDAIAIIKQHLAHGSTVILATASFDFLIRPLAQFLKIPEAHVITTTLEYENNKATGCIVGRMCFGLEKLRRCTDLLKRKSIPLERAAFYSDSVIDIGMMTRVGFPVATNPDICLGREARKNNWEILRLR